MDRSLPVAAAVVVVVLVCCSGLCRADRLGARECEGLGFTGLPLCSDCNALSEFVKDQVRAQFVRDLTGGGAEGVLCSPATIASSDLLSPVTTQSSSPGRRWLHMGKLLL